MRLYESMAEKRSLDSMEELYAIVQACEHLEKAYVKDLMSPEQYTLQCQKLISQYDQLVTTLKWGQVQVEHFLKDYGILLPAAHQRLVIDKVPATAVHTTGAGEIDAKSIFEATSALITALDTLRMMSAIDEILPLFKYACEKINEVANAPSDWEPRVRLSEWLRKLRGMSASDVLGEADRRQILLDLESAHEEFGKLLSRGRQK